MIRKYEIISARAYPLITYKLLRLKNMASMINQTQLAQPQEISQTTEEFTRTLNLILEGAMSRAAEPKSTKPKPVSLDP